MNLSSPPSEPPPTSRVAKSLLSAMVIILVGMALLALYANVQRWRRAKVENVIVIPAASPSPPAR